MSESIIQIQHLSKTFGTGDTAVHALEDINLDIKQGEIFGIIGLSGAGKSTLVRCISRLKLWKIMVTSRRASPAPFRKGPSSPCHPQ